MYRKRISRLAFKKRGAKFGRKKAVGCVVVNFGFETGDFTGWNHNIAAVETNGAPEGTHYVRMLAFCSGP